VFSKGSTAGADVATGVSMAFWFNALQAPSTRAMSSREAGARTGIWQ
jgi:hypothetical protein